MSKTTLGVALAATVAFGSYFQMETSAAAFTAVAAEQAVAAYNMAAQRAKIAKITMDVDTQFL
ncbi:MAG: hypothetical protein KUG56_07690, partial [Kordiimonadaceae bacterium]|nr:hypothetical protein [Kordiimonadaceae bacterium]